VLTRDLFDRRCVCDSGIRENYFEFGFNWGSWKEFVFPRKVSGRRRQRIKKVGL